VATPTPSLGVPAEVALTGADLYRLNCQACHGLEGKGAGAEIKSAVDPVRGVPLDVLRAQLKAQHQPASEAEARAKPEHVRAEILRRMHKGGQRMPSREHLTAVEMDRLFAYLGVLAGSPQAGPAKRETVNWARVGQHVVKGTCHICHDAVGPRPSAEQMGQGKIPSFQSLLASQAVAEFVIKARTGAPVDLTGLSVLHRGRMPVFYYLRDEEIAAAYVYLATYPPQAGTAR
jgi:mono/diheme cytochrome c family protein